MIRQFKSHLYTSGGVSKTVLPAMYVYENYTSTKTAWERSHTELQTNAFHFSKVYKQKGCDGICDIKVKYTSNTSLKIIKIWPKHLVYDMKYNKMVVSDGIYNLLSVSYKPTGWNPSQQSCHACKATLSICFPFVWGRRQVLYPKRHVLPFLKWTKSKGRAMAQEVSRRPLNAEIRARTQVNPCGICRRHRRCDTLLSEHFISLVSIIPPELLNHILFTSQRQLIT